MDRFAAASAQCDLMLDSIGWSGGNTTLEALAQDLPVVTFEGALMRGRVSAGILRMMGMPETVGETVDDYVALARPHGPRPSLARRASRRASQATSTGSTATAPASQRWKISSSARRASAPERTHIVAPRRCERRASVIFQHRSTFPLAPCSAFARAIMVSDLFFFMVSKF